MIPAMSQLPYTLYRATDVRQLDQIAMTECGIPGIELMNRAGSATFDELCCRWPDARNIVVVCGAGNNAGDGYVVASQAHEKGYSVRLFALTNPDELQGDAATAWGAARAAGLTTEACDVVSLSHSDVVVDAIFGTGLNRAVEGRWAEVIDAINASGVPVLAIDIPSGLHADTGCVMGHAIQADATVSFIGLKQGMFTASGVDCCGVVGFDDLGVPKSVYQRVEIACQRIDWLKQRSSLPARPRSAHKGLYGHSLIVGGNYGMAGAARLAAEAAARTGSGLTSVATRPEHVAAMTAARPEVMWHGVANSADLSKLIEHASVIAIGPGLGQDDWAIELLEAVLQSGKPVVADADALNLLVYEPVQYSNWILTPHPGEAGRLLGSSSREINQRRFDAGKAIAEKFSAVTVLKGAGSLVCSPEGQTALCSDGNPGMATAGMGDVLTGVIASFIAQGFGLFDAARMGVALHAAAADKAAMSGERGMIAGDVINTLRSMVN